MGSAAVLVVEDEPIIRLSIVDALGLEGIEALEAASSDEALKLLLTGTKISVLLADVKMPGPIDGLDLANHVAACWPEVAIFVMSGHVYADDPRMPRGVTFLPKPFSLSGLAAAIQERLHQSWLWSPTMTTSPSADIFAMSRLPSQSSQATPGL